MCAVPAGQSDPRQVLPRLWRPPLACLRRLWHGAARGRSVLPAVRRRHRRRRRGPRPLPAPETYTPKHLAEKILTSKAALEGERKQVTVLFADLKGSMELLADRDPEEARQLLDPVLERMMEAVHRYEGTVNQVMGDGIMALFGAPLAHEDHAVRACYAALRMQDAVKRYAEEARRAHGVNVQIRVGLNSGEVVVRAIGSDLHMDYTAVGQTTHLAARMEQLASPGSTLLTPATLELVEGFVAVKPLGPVPVKGLADAGRGLRGDGSGAGADPAAGGRPARPDAVRRPRSPSSSSSAGAPDSPASGHGQIVAIVGEAGVGKSRLVHEFTHSHRLQGWLILESAAVSYGKATSYLPVIDLLKSYFKIQDRDDLREVREKVTGKLLTLDRALEPTLPALLALLDVPVDDVRVADARPGAASAAHPRRREAAPAAGSARATAPPRPRGPSLDRRRDPGRARHADREPGVGAPAAARGLPARIPARLGRQDVLQPAAAGRAPGRERRRAAGRAPRRRSRAGATQAAPRQARESVLPGRDRANPGGDEGARRASEDGIG